MTSISVAFRHTSEWAAITCLLGSQAFASNSMESLVQVPDGINLVGGVIGRVPEFWGANHNANGLAPMLRKQLDGDRYLQLLGTELTYNMLDHPHWRAGPSLGVRLGRDDVTDTVVRRMQPIDGTGEVGVFVSYTDPLGTDPRHRWGFNLAVAGAPSNVYSGIYGSASVHWLKPVLPWLTASASAGVGFGTAGFQSTYFGVSSEDSHLFPRLAGRSYEPGGGLTDVRLLLGGLVHLSQSWHLVVGARWQRLVSGAADSPLVRERGNATQWMLGSGLVYTWR